MAEHQANRQGESREGPGLSRSRDRERGLAGRQYQDPFSMLESMFERMQREFFGSSLLGGLLPQSFTEGQRGAPRVPRMQVRDAGDAVVVTAELPGIDQKDVDVRIENDMLDLRADAQQEEETGGQKVESYVAFSRQMRLPENVDTERASAVFKNGMLTIRFPKRGTGASGRRIPISTESRSESSPPRASGAQPGSDPGRAA